MHLLHSHVNQWSCTWRHGVTQILTFDQPLWWKALMIVESEPKGSDLRRIVLHLGSFHTEMNFLGCSYRVFDGFIWAAWNPWVNLHTQCSCLHAKWQGYCTSCTRTLQCWRSPQCSDNEKNAQCSSNANLKHQRATMITIQTLLKLLM